MERKTGASVIEIRSETDAIVLREITLVDAQTYFDLVDYDRQHLSQFDDKTAAKYPDVESVEKSIHNYPKNKIRFGIWDDGVMVGSRNLTYSDDRKDVELGVWVSQKYLGHHYSTRSNIMAQEFAFRDSQVEKVFCAVEEDNAASIKSVERAGLVLSKKEGGKLFFEMTRAQWQACQDKVEE